MNLSALPPWHCPLLDLSGQVSDISFLLHFPLLEPAYYKVDQSEHDFHFPLHFNEKHGHWVGFPENNRNHFTWKILTDDTQKGLIKLISSVPP